MRPSAGSSGGCGQDDQGGRGKKFRRDERFAWLMGREAAKQQEEILAGVPLHFSPIPMSEPTRLVDY
ncbi:MAG: hypothetical protein AAF958_05845 [Planctomycetota bacterium]